MYARLIDLEDRAEATRPRLGLSGSAHLCDGYHNDDADHMLRAKSCGLFSEFSGIHSLLVLVLIGDRYDDRSSS